MPYADSLPKARLVVIGLFALLVTFCAFSLLGSDVSTASSNSNHLSLAPSSTHGLPTNFDMQASMPLATSTPGCGPAWSVVPSPNARNYDILYGVALSSSNDVWAVGYYGGSTGFQTLVEHWDGSTWSIVPSPNQGLGDNYLYGVAVSSSNDIWAIGYYNNGSINQTLVEHWDGSAWSIVPSPNQGQYNNVLYGVAVASPNDVWAVGQGSNVQTLVEHWNGSAWSIVPSPNQGSYENYLYGVAVASSNDIWAVGYYQDNAYFPLVYTLVEHWNGSTWNIVPSANPGPAGNYLYGVAVSSSNDIWAVGYYNNGGPSYQGQTLVEHWNGADWSVVSSPNQGQYSNDLYGVAVASPNDVWAVGRYYNGSFYERLIEHWNGSAWGIVPSPNPGPAGSTFNGLATASSNDVWAVGYFGGYTGLQTLVERFGLCVANATSTLIVTPSSTSTPTPIVTPSRTPTFVPPPCPGERFTDVCPGDYFYTATLALADDGIISGYSTTPPCDNSLWIPCFKPYNNVTRGQASKIVSLAANFNDPVTGQTFEDVPPGSTFYTYTERMAERGIIVGYPCGGPYEPCIPPNSRPYFRPGNNLTRGQMAKIVANSFGWHDPPEGQDFQDVPPGATFYTCTAQLYIRNIIGGYPCGGPGEPCVPPDNLPYYRPNNNVIRGQTAKIVQLARTQPTVTPTPTYTATDTENPLTTASTTPTTLTSTPTATPTESNTPHPTPTFCLGNYTVGVGTGSITPGTTFVPGSNCDDCVSAVPLPFPFRFYDLTFSTANVSSNGNIQFVSSAPDPSNACLPFAPFNYAIMPYWDDQLLTGPGQGVYTSVSGSAPFRTFNIEWRGTYAGGVGSLDYEVQLHENSYSGQINFVYGTVTEGGSGATIGVQRDSGSLYTQYECNTGGLVAGRALYFGVAYNACVTPSVTATPSNTRTPTITPTGTLPTATHTLTNTPFVTRTSTPTATYTATATSSAR